MTIVLNKSPLPNKNGVDGYSLISFDVVNETGFPSNFISVYINDSSALSNNVFYYPFNGTDSSIEPTTIGIYEGFHITIESTEMLPSKSLYDVKVKVLSILIDEWQFRTGMGFESIEISTYENILELTFEEDLTLTSEISSPGNYIFTNGMYASYAETLSSKKVKLWVELFQSNSFQLSVNENILDQYGEPLPNSYNSISFSPFYSSASISNYNGKIRTWRESNLVFADSQRIYLAGIKGIDVFKKLSGTLNYKWAQIFSNEVNSMFVANFGGDYIFTDTTAPTITNRNPFPGGIALPEDSVSFTLIDADSSIEITGITVYFNNEVVFFGGYGGWRDNYSGYFIPSYKSIECVIRPINNFENGEVLVRVVANDLLSNSLDISYSFTVQSTPIVESGFGGSKFGISSFGG